MYFIEYAIICHTCSLYCRSAFKSVSRCKKWNLPAYVAINIDISILVYLYNYKVKTIAVAICTIYVIRIMISHMKKLIVWGSKPWNQGRPKFSIKKIRALPITLNKGRYMMLGKLSLRPFLVTLYLVFRALSKRYIVSFQIIVLRYARKTFPTAVSTVTNWE